MFLKGKNMYVSFTFYLIYISNSPSLGTKFYTFSKKLDLIFFFLIFNFILCENDWFCAFFSTRVFCINSNSSISIKKEMNVTCILAIMTHA